MRNSALLGAAAVATMVGAAPALAAPTLIGSFTGNVCGGAGGINNCFATTSGTVVQGNPGTAGSSPLIARIDSNANFGQGGTEVSTLFSTVTGSDFAITYNAANNSLSFLYTPGAGDPVIHYFGISQANGYNLYYDSTPITSGTINLSTLYPNNPGWSHIDFFDTGVGSVPEPGTWAMMLLGFGAIGMVVRRRKSAATNQSPRTA
jgi:hypothetical protein